MLKLVIDRDEFEDFRKRYRLPPLSLYALRCREKKLLEHHIAFKLLDPKPRERYVDFASENSPFPGILRRRSGVEAYSQDLAYVPGIRGARIGSSADALPVPDGWIDKASLQCSLEHFERDIDTSFMRELGRVLRVGGRCVVVPLYIQSTAQNIYDPLLYSDFDPRTADAGALLVAEIGLGGRFERVYSPETLGRLFNRSPWLQLTLYEVSGGECIVDERDSHALGQVRRVRYALVIDKLPADVPSEA